MRSVQFLTVLTVLAAACGDDGATSSSSGGGAAACTPGEQVACACPGGVSGTQVCNAEGTALLACSCGGATATTSTSTSTASGAGGDTSSSDGGGTTTGADGGGGSAGDGGGGATAEGGGGGTGTGGDAPVGTSWLLGFGDAGYEQVPQSLAVRPDGGVIVAIYGRGTFDIGGQEYSSVNDPDAAIVSIGADGVVEGFVHIVGTGTAPEAYALAPLTDGTFVVGGRFCNPTDFGDGVVNNDECDAFLAHYDEGGTLVDVRIAGGPGHQDVGVVAPLGVDVVATLTGSPIDLGTGPVTSGINQVVARLEGGTDAVWVRGFDATPASGFATLQAIDADPDSGIVVAGDLINGGADFGDGALLGPSQSGAFIARFDVDGEPVTSRGIACSSGGALTVDLAPDGAIGMWGRGQGVCDIEGFAETQNLRYFYARFDADDGDAFVRNEDWPCTLSASIEGEGLLLAGYCTGTIDFGTGATEPNGDPTDVVTLRLDDDGAVTDVVRYGPQGTDARLLRGPNGELAAMGRVCADLDLGFGSYEHQGACDAWVARIDDP